MNAPDLDPLTKLYEAVRTSERMKGIGVYLGPRAAPPETSAPRVVMVPTAGPLQPPDHDGNVVDVVVALRCECWGNDLPRLWETMRRLTLAIRDYSYTGDESADETADGVVDCIRVEPVSVEFDEDPDTNRQGWAAELTFNVTASFESTPLSADSGTGTVSDVVVAPA